MTIKKISKEKWNWKVFSKVKPITQGLYVVLIQKDVKRAWDYYEDVYNNTRLPNSPRSTENIMLWAQWGYEEHLTEVTDTHTIYEKEWNFYDKKNQSIEGVLYWIEIPPYPSNIKDIENED